MQRMGKANSTPPEATQQHLNQIVAIVVTWIYCIGMSLIIIKGVDLLVGLRVTANDEIEGLDSSQHGESGYNLEEA